MGQKGGEHFKISSHQTVCPYVGSSLVFCFSLFGFLKIFIYLFILATLDLSYSTWDHRCSMKTLSCCMWTLVVACMWDLVTRPGIEPRPPALGARSLTHWTTREVPEVLWFYKARELCQVSKNTWPSQSHSPYVMVHNTSKNSYQPPKLTLCRTAKGSE